jgi:hypothetical protein
MSFLELLGAYVKDRELRFPSAPLLITRARIIECRFKTLAPIGELSNLQSLEIFNYPDADLEPLRPLQKLEQLRIHHLPRVTSLEPLDALQALRRLWLETRPSWDASGKVTEVESLLPLQRIPHLEQVQLFGVRPKSRTIDDLLNLPNLQRARVSKFPKSEIRRLAAAVSNAYCDWL